jgi:catechol 2,3-dioxygenase-like lactoylglutathione lyase family enzyme
MTTAKVMKPTGILHFAIGVSDLEEGRKFYEGVLGCTYLRQNDDSVFMQAGNEYFVLTNAGKHTRPNPPGGYEFHHAFIVDGGDFDATCAYLEESGFPILIYEDEGHRTFTGRHAYIQDPFGNALEIIDFHGIGDSSKPDFLERQRRQTKAKDE